MTNVLVTGGRGFIGRHVCAALKAQGMEPVTFDILDGQDVRDYGRVCAAVTGVQHVVHLAALVSVPLSIKEPRATFEHNVLGTQNVLDAAREAGLPGRVVFASSAAVYGFEEREKHKEADADTVKLTVPYAASKRINEQQALCYRSYYGLKTVGLRFFNAYGVGQDSSNPYAGVLSFLADAVLNNKTFKLQGDGGQTRDFIAVTDVAAAVAGLVALPDEVETPAVLNVGTGKSVTLLQVIAALETLLGRKLRIENLPSREGDIRNSCSDVGALQAVLPQWKPVGLEEGLRLWLKDGEAQVAEAA